MATETPLQSSTIELPRDIFERVVERIEYLEDRGPQPQGAGWQSDELKELIALLREKLIIGVKDKSDV